MGMWRFIGFGGNDEGEVPRRIVDAESRYGAAILSAIGRAVAVALVVIAAQAVFVGITSIAADPGAVRMTPALVDATAGAGAFVLLIPLGIALQVLIRIPRDPETTNLEDGAARRQFWGNVSAIVAMASAFVALSTLLQAIITTAPTGRIDAVATFGVPLAGVVVMLLAADGAALGALESRRLNLDTARRTARIEQLTSARDSIPGANVEHPVQRIVSRSLWVGLSVIAVGALTVWVCFGHLGLVLAYAVISAMATAYIVAAVAHTLSNVVQGKLADAAMTLPLLGLILVVFFLQALPAVWSVSGLDSLARFYAGIGYGALILLPPIATVIANAATRPVSRRSDAAPAPFLAVARLSLDRRITALAGLASGETETPTWRRFAWAAVLASPIAAAGLGLAGVAHWHRRGSGSLDGRRLHLAAWTMPVAFLVIEAAALLLLPFYGSALGWFVLP